jgi:cell division protein FtsZ
MAQPMQRTGTDNLPILTQPVGAGQGVGAGSHASHGAHAAQAGHGHTMAPQSHNFEGLNTPSVWHSARSHAAAKVDALVNNGMEEIEIPAFLRKQPD